MEKSMIQDLENVRTSIGFKNTFTTSSRDGGYDLRKYISYYQDLKSVIFPATKNLTFPSSYLS